MLRVNTEHLTGLSTDQEPVDWLFYLHQLFDTLASPFFCSSHFLLLLRLHVSDDDLGDDAVDEDTEGDDDELGVVEQPGVRFDGHERDVVESSRTLEWSKHKESLEMKTDLASVVDDFGAFFKRRKC